MNSRTFGCSLILRSRRRSSFTNARFSKPATCMKFNESGNSHCTACQSCIYIMISTRGLRFAKLRYATHRRKANHQSKKRANYHSYSMLTVCACMLCSKNNHSCMMRSRGWSRKKNSIKVLKKLLNMFRRHLACLAKLRMILCSLVCMALHFATFILACSIVSIVPDWELQESQTPVPLVQHSCKESVLRAV